MARSGWLLSLTALGQSRVARAEAAVTTFQLLLPFLRLESLLELAPPVSECDCSDSESVGRSLADTC